jgi:ribonuclease-3
MRPVIELLEKLNIKPKHISLYEVAFTHSSYNADANTKHHDYERLEYLGDSVIGLVVSEVSYGARPEMSQGPLTKMKSALVSTNSLADLARSFDFPNYIRVGNSFSGDVSKANHLLEDVFEAFFGALYLDQGFEVARRLLIDIFIGPIKAYNIEDTADYKSKLQEEMQAEHRESVVYEVISETGPSHDRHFVVHVMFDGIELGVGEGSTKKQAEQMAAKAALKKEATK